MEEYFDKIINRKNTRCAKYDEAYTQLGNDILPCAVADMDFLSPEPIRKALSEVVEHGIFGYTNLPTDYTTVVKQWIEKEYGCNVCEKWILFSPRINMGLNMAVETLTQPGDKIMVHTPAYPALVDAVVKTGRNLVEAPLVLQDSIWKIDFNNMKQLADSSLKMLILCNPHNPTGRVWSLDELKKIEQFCLSNGLYLLCDEIHADLIRSYAKFESVLQLSEEMKKKLLVFQSITKTFNVPGIILSNVIIPDDNVRKKMKITIDRWGLHNPNVFAASIIEPAYKEKQCKEWLNSLKKYLDKNMEFLQKYINENMPDFNFQIPQGTYLAWINYKKTGWTEEEAEQFFLQKAGVGVYMGNHFGKSGEGYFRLNVGIPLALLKEILDKIKKAYNADKQT